MSDDAPADEDPDDEADASGGASDPRAILPTMQGRPDLEMNAIGWLVFLILIVLLIPLLPALLLAVVLARLFGFGGDRKRQSWGNRPLNNGS